MGSTRLGGQNTTPAAIRTNHSKRQNILATNNKTNPSPSLINNNDNGHGNSNKNDGTETVWSTTQERGQAIIHTGRPSTKRPPPHITTISTTRNNNSGILSGTTSRNSTRRSSSNCSRTRTSLTSTGSTTTTTTNTTSLLPPPPPPPPPPPAAAAAPPPLLTLTVSSPPPPLLHTTNPATDDTSPTSPTPLTTIHPGSRPCSPSLSLAARRRPLKLRDQNVGPGLAPTLKENKKMGHETSLNPSATTHTRPQMPSLSATVAKGPIRPPLTPKIASASRQSQSQTPSLAATTNTTATTPLPRRTQKRPVSTIVASSSSNNRASYDESDTVSVAAFSPHLSSNVTPRSGSRQSRVDSANSTPNGTPSHNRSDSWDSKSAFPFSSPFGQGDLPRRPVVTFSAVSPDKNMPLRQDNSNTRDAKFFHASDAKTSRPTSAHKLASPNNSTFFYANGNGIKPKSSSPAALSPPLSPGLNRSQENASSKFMYANGTPELRPTPPPIVSRGSGSTVPTASKGPTVRSAATLQRPVSPSKLPLHSSSYRNSIGSQSTNSSTAAVSAARVQVSSQPSSVPSTPGLRRPDIPTSPSSGHSRSGSSVRGEAICEPLKPMASPTTGLFPPVSLSPTNPSPLTLASIIQAAEEFAEHENDGSPDDQSMLQSPTKSNGSSTDPVTELIANARRERKVQDLQIRNASLEAINRTLERQLRKQTAELRRHRRLSRASHLSLASATTASRVPSGAISELEMEPQGLTDLSEEQLSTEELEEESFSDNDSVSSGVSPSILAERDEKYRHGDEERLKLDLSKHQQILVDSQKINQSIKRCLDWTEELINEGKKALEYKVRVSDIRLGGRVLVPLDEEDETSKLPPPDDTIAPDVKPIEEVSETSMSWGTEPQDRDSGIELPKDG
ncbi:hypothetical protein F4860DRAFT_476641 [Xylaria cubensis]|nr:hypothetical protein F4860DRAFT_476641 [Xylaria cubensis]